MKVLDAAGREWKPRVTCLVFVQVERKMGTDFQTVVHRMEAGSMLAGFELSYAACLDQANELKLSFDQFCAAFTNLEQMETLFTAVGEAALTFFPNGASPAPASKTQAKAEGGEKATSTK